MHAIRTPEEQSIRSSVGWLRACGRNLDLRDDTLVAPDRGGEMDAGSIALEAGRCSRAPRSDSVKHRSRQNSPDVRHGEFVE